MIIGIVNTGLACSSLILGSFGPMRDTLGRPSDPQSFEFRLKEAIEYFDNPSLMKDSNATPTQRKALSSCLVRDYAIFTASTIEKQEWAEEGLARFGFISTRRTTQWKNPSSRVKFWAAPVEDVLLQLELLTWQEESKATPKAKPQPPRFLEPPANTPITSPSFTTF